MKRYEVTRQPRDGDFPWQHRYTDNYRVCAPFGSTPVWGCMGTLPNEPIQPLLFSLSMIAHALADDEHLAQALLVATPRSEAI